MSYKKKEILLWSFEVVYICRYIDNDYAYVLRAFAKLRSRTKFQFNADCNHDEVVF